MSDELYTPPTTDLVPVEDGRLEKLVSESDLDSTKAAVLLENFRDYFQIASEWEVKARAIVVTDAGQKAEMDMARVGRLFLREKRLAVEKTRKSLKEQALREGKAIDGIANVLKAVIVPIEQYLGEQENFVKIQAAAEVERVAAEMVAKAEADRLAAEMAERVEQERVRLENFRLRVEADKAEAERQKVEAERIAEVKAAEDARLAKEREAEAERRRAEDARVEAEKEVEDKRLAVQREIEVAREKVEAVRAAEAKAVEDKRLAREREIEAERVKIQKARDAEKEEAAKLAQESADRATATVKAAQAKVIEIQRKADEKRAEAEASAAAEVECPACHKRFVPK